MFSLRNLGVLCASAVEFCPKEFTADAEYAEEAQSLCATDFETGDRSHE